MKRILFFSLALVLMASQVLAADINDWKRGDASIPVKGTDNISDVDTLISNYIVDPLDKVLTHHIWGATLTHTSDDVITISAGEVVCSNGAGTIRRFRKNTSTTTVDFTAAGVGGIDSGSARDDSSWFAIYAVADADATTFTAIAAKQGTALSDVTYYRYLGSVYNDASDDIDNFYWFGYGPNPLVMWDVPVNVTTTVSDKTWSASTSCSTGMPSTSTVAIFGLFAADVGGAYSGIWIRPNGSTWATNEANGIMVRSADAYISGQRVCATDTSQNIQSYNDANDTDGATRVDVEGFYINR